MLTDAYVCLTFGRLVHQTKVQRKTLNPVWDEKFRFEITDDELLVEGACVPARVIQADHRT
jgi:Ca2+-dependent lipid-binding protein